MYESNYTELRKIYEEGVVIWPAERQRGEDGVGVRGHLDRTP